MSFMSAAMGAMGVIPGIIKAAEEPRAARPNKPKMSEEDRTALALSSGLGRDVILTRSGRAPLGGTTGNPVPGVGGGGALG